jgi:HlyD family secretion protein
MTEREKTMKKRNKLILWAVMIVLVVGLGLGLWKTGQGAALISKVGIKTATPVSTTYQTSAAKIGNLSVSVSGSGNVVAANTVDLAFLASGTIAKLNVNLGDKVTKGQVLASLGDVDSLQLEVKEYQVAVQKAQKALDDLLSPKSSTLSQAQLDLASAQQTFAEAQAALHKKGDSRCAPSLTEDYYYQYLNAQRKVDEWESYLYDQSSGYGHEYILQRLTPMHKERDLAYSNYTYCQSYTAEEIQASQAAFQLAKANMEQAEANFNAIKSGTGVDPQTLELDQATLKNAQLQLANAQNQLSGTSIIAPMDGVVVTINGEVGKTASGAVITLADLNNPLVKIYIDETDLADFAVGCTAEVTFDALSGQTFPGTVTQVTPSLVSVQSVNMIEGLVELQKKQALSGRALPLGLSANAEITCQQANNVLIIPAQSVYEENGQVYVYVLNAQGQPEKRTVEVGLKSVASAEIRSGLTEGEKVITSQVENKK